MEEWVWSKKWVWYFWVLVFGERSLGVGRVGVASPIIAWGSGPYRLCYRTFADNIATDCDIGTYLSDPTCHIMTVIGPHML